MEPMPVLGGGLPAVLVAAQLRLYQCVNGVLPRPGGNAVVGACEVCLGNLEIEHGLALGFVLGGDDLFGLVFVDGLEAGTFAGGFVHAIEGATTAATGG